jgi:peptidoglycan/LPS O-acetylase OafA/YrhL
VRRLGVRPALDGLRGAAVLAVLATHFGAFLIPAGSF